MKRIRNLFLITLTLLISTGLAKADVLEPVKWKTSYEKVDGNIYNIVFEGIIEKGWHLYGLKIPDGGPIALSFNFEENNSFSLIDAPVSNVNPEVKYDETFEMELELFDNAVVFKQRIEIPEGKGIVKGYIEYMACDDSRCSPPLEVEFSFNIGGASETVVAANEDKEESTPKFALNKLEIDVVPEETEEAVTGLETQNATPKETLTADAERDETKEPLWILFLKSILGGLGAIITPCVYPIIPLTVSFFAAGSASKMKTISKALAFGISLIAIYTSVGLISGLFQVDLMTAVTSHWIPNLIFFLLFITFAASFFGAFEIMLPNKWANKIDQKADKGGIVGAFFMALATAVVSFSCTGPIAGVVLGNAMQGDIQTPVIGMFGFGFGFALPFTLLAFFPSVQKSLPKSGGWLNAVKVVFAFLMLLFSLIFLGLLGNGAIPRDMILAIAVVILAALGFYLIGKLKFSHDSDLPYISVPRILLAIVSWSFALYLVTGIFGAPLTKIASFLPPEHTSGINLNKASAGVAHDESNTTCIDNPKWSDKLHLPEGLKGYYDWDEALACAKQKNKPVLVDFVGHSCKNCKKMYAEVWSDPAVLKRLRNDFVILAMYTDDRTKLPEDEWVTSTLDGRVKKTLGKKNLDFQVTKYESNALPMYVIVDPNGKILTNTQKYYTYSSDVNAFLDFLNEGIKNFK